MDGRSRPRRRPILIDQFLEDAIEVDVDALCDGSTSSSAASCSNRGGGHRLRRFGKGAAALQDRSASTSSDPGLHRRLGLALKVKGLMNVQYAIKDDVVYVLEVNPRASRTAPFVSKATGRPLAKIAAKVVAGRTLGSSGSRRSSR